MKYLILIPAFLTLIACAPQSGTSSNDPNAAANSVAKPSLIEGQWSNVTSKIHSRLGRIYNSQIYTFTRTGEYEIQYFAYYETINSTYKRVEQGTYQIFGSEISLNITAQNCPTVSYPEKMLILSNANLQSLSFNWPLETGGMQSIFLNDPQLSPPKLSTNIIMDYDCSHFK